MSYPHVKTDPIPVPHDNGVGIDITVDLGPNEGSVYGVVPVQLADGVWRAGRPSFDGTFEPTPEQNAQIVAAVEQRAKESDSMLRRFMQG